MLSPVDTKPKFSASLSPSFADLTLYCNHAGALHYLTFTRPNICYAMQHVCLFMHYPMDSQMHSRHQILRSNKGTLHYSLHLYRYSTSSLILYIDGDWTGCQDLNTLLLAIVFSWVIILFPSCLSDKPLYLVLTLKLNMTALLILCLILVGYEIHFLNFTDKFLKKSFFTVIIYVLFIYRKT